MQKRILVACLFPASVMLASCLATTEIPFVLKEVTAVTSPTTSTTPSYSFSSDLYGTISYAGGCSSTTTAAISGINQITFNTLAVGTYNYCTIKVTTSTGKVSAPLAVSPFIVNSAGQNVTQVTPVATPTGDNTPNYVFNSTVAGAITYAGGCTSATASAVVGNNTVTFNTLADGTYSACTIKVGTGTVAVSPFTVDTVKPILAQVTPVTAVSTVKTPSYTFSSTEAGTITYAGGCTSATTAAVAGNTTVTFNSLAAGTYAACTITVKDAANNTSLVLAIPSFTIVKAEPLNDTGMNLCGDFASKISTMATLTSANNLPGSGYVVGTYNNVPLTGGAGTGAQATMVVAAATGVVTAFGAITGGSGYVNGSYTNVVLTGGTGTLARANITVSGGAVTAVTLVFGGSGYAAANSLTTAVANIGGGAGTGFAVAVSTIATQNRVSTVTITARGSGYKISDALTAANTNLGGAGSGFSNRVATLGDFNNAIVCATAGVTQTVAGADSDSDPVPQGQDAVYGRDAGATTDADGKAGFAYQKLGATGLPLENQSGTYTAADAGSEAAGTKWSCVKDLTTNLVWEIKTDAAAPDFRDKDHKYTWYNSTGVNTGNAAGTGDTGAAVGSDACTDTARCDTEKYVADVNAANICGETANDWRVPSAAELDSLRALSNNAPAIDTAFFPNTMATSVNYWTSTPDASSSANAWAVNVSSGVSALVAKSSTATHLRLVRGGF